MRARVVVVGGGIGGLAAAHRLHRLAEEAGVPLALTVLEASARFGGVIAGERRDGFTLELGPDAVLTVKPAAVTLMREVGLGDDIIGTEPGGRRALIARGDRLLPVPDGFYLLAPARLWPFVTSRLVSWPGKARMALDLVLPRRRAGLPEESLAAFVRRRLGREALERIAQPMVSGIWSADPERLSLEATMPQFLEMERTHRSLILALRARAGAPGADEATGPRYGMFATLRGGLDRLPAALVDRLGGDDLRPGVTAVSLARTNGAWRVGTSSGESLAADAVVIALPGPAAAPLLRPIDSALADDLAGVTYSDVATVNLAFAATQAPALPQAAGFVVPAVENRLLLACTIASTKFAGRAPEGFVLLRALAGGGLRSADLARDDGALVEALLADLRTLLGVRGEPRFAVVRRWRQALPQYALGHCERVARMRAAEARLPALALVGSAFEGTGVPDVIAGADAAARRLGPARLSALLAPR